MNRAARFSLASFDRQSLDVQRSRLVQLLWFFLGRPLLFSSLLHCYCFRRNLLRTFGAAIGSGVMIKGRVRVKYPWKLQIERDSWVGEDVWIDNVSPVQIGRNSVISQGSYLCAANHDWTDPSFPIRPSAITVGDFVWIAARSTIGPAVIVGDRAIITLGSVVTQRVPAGQLCSGNPARLRSHEDTVK